ncbi:hypothetical protein SBC1_54090 (plasmid) [Caballeronia sp. SBC1]|nr:hypothetical protein SBC2_52290 [Caballeronia sp. SBC2]QIN65364.1 hypothetical protein SBC1_54090 [Caballeronia sp. SBC1]
MLRAKRDVAEVKAFFRKAIKRQVLPKTITLDGYAASHGPVREMKAGGLLPAATEVRSAKYLNSATGKRLTGGTGRTSCCLRSYARPASSISRERRSIRRRCEPLGRAKNWPEPYRSLATRFQTSHPRRCERRPHQCHPGRYDVK